MCECATRAGTSPVWKEASRVETDGRRARNEKTDEALARCGQTLTDQMCKQRSTEPLTRYCPFGLNATEYTGSLQRTNLQSQNR